jgi:hypothetical protein
MITIHKIITTAPEALPALSFGLTILVMSVVYWWKDRPAKKWWKQKEYEIRHPTKSK